MILFSSCGIQPVLSPLSRSPGQPWHDYFLKLSGPARMTGEGLMVEHLTIRFKYTSLGGAGLKSNNITFC